MPRIIAFALLGAAFLLGSLPAVADPDTTRERVYRLGPISRFGAPPQDYLYVNEHGFWSIGPGQAVGQATYLWRGALDPKYTEPLRFIGRTTFTDSKNGIAHRGWLYQVVDPIGPATYWFFAEAPLLGADSGEVLYPLFYSLEDLPPREAVYHRYLTGGGTKRL